MGKQITCYHQGCTQPPMRVLKITPVLSVAYCNEHYWQALERKGAYLARGKGRELGKGKGHA